MKIHVVNKGEDHIEGYERIEPQNGEINLSGFSDNECDFIMASDCLDFLGYNSAKDFLMQSRQKLRINGTLLVGGADIRMLARSIIDESIDLETANGFIFSKKSLLDVNTVSGMVSELGLQIVSTRISGIHYEIESSRKLAAN